MRLPRKPTDIDNRDYEVGFKRPPVATRFKPGNPGNTKRRPKKRPTVGQIIEGSLKTKVTVMENGRSKTMTAEEVIIRKLTLDAAGGDKRAIQTLFSLRDRYQDSNETTLDIAELQSDDRKILDAYFATLRGNSASGASDLVEGGLTDSDQPTASDGTEGDS